MAHKALIDLTIEQYADTQKQLHEMVADVDDAKMAQQFPGIANHPAWTLGHLCTGAALILTLLDEPGNHFAGFDTKVYGPGSTPVSERNKYPSKVELLGALTRLHAQIGPVVRAKHADYFDKPSPEYLRAFAPTVGKIVFYLLATHESFHIGQLAQWKRASK